MPEEYPLDRTIEEWEALFTNESYLTPTGHGDMSRLDLEAAGWCRSALEPTVRATAYSELVTAVLNRWSEISDLCRGKYMTDPVFQVAAMAFSESSVDWKDGPSSLLRDQFERLWTESPRPHDDELRFLAISFGQFFPISPVAISCLFQQPGWPVVAARIASHKGYVNLAIELLQELKQGDSRVSATAIAELPNLGFPKHSALKWMRTLHPDNAYAQVVCQYWEPDLVDEGWTIEQIYSADT